MEQKSELQKQHSGIWRSLRDGDFEEEEVWDVVNEKPQYYNNNKNKNHHSSGILKPKQSLSSSCSSTTTTSSPLSVPRPLPSASRMIPKTNSSNNIHTSTYNSSIEAKFLQQSAPVNIPDWSKIYNKNNNNNKQNNKPLNNRVSRLQDYNFDEDEDDGDGDGDGDNEEVIKYGGNTEDEDEVEEEEDDEYDLKVPPHEFIARRLARAQISSFSVFEGVGRTLKGRDLSKVRNAILTKTGFLESL